MSSEEEELGFIEEQTDRFVEGPDESDDDEPLEEDEGEYDYLEEQPEDLEDDDEIEETLPTKKKRKLLKKSEFIDDEAELSGDDEVSEDEAENSDEDNLDVADLVDKEAPELDSDEEEAIRGLYHKQLATEDRRAVLLLQEQLEDNAVDLGQGRRKRFTWQTRELMEGNLLQRHSDPNDDASHDCDDSDDDDMPDIQLRLRRPSVDALLFGTRQSASSREPRAGTSRDTNTLFSDDSNSNTMGSLSHMTHEQLVASRMGPAATTITTNTTTDMNRFLYRDKELVQALSTRETVITSREDKDRVIQRELKRVLQSKSIFDQLYS